jgi:hypothetical protein
MSHYPARRRGGRAMRWAERATPQALSVLGSLIDDYRELIEAQVKASGQVLAPHKAHSPQQACLTGCCHPP